MKQRTVGLAIATATLLIAAPAIAETPPLYAAANCANCHGTDGKGTSVIPPLAGRDKAYLEDVLKGYKAGSRPATIMHQLAKGYTDEELSAFAAYFASQK